MRKILVVTAVAALIVGCSDKSNVQQQAATPAGAAKASPAAAAAAPQVAQAAPAAAPVTGVESSSKVSGTVLEAQDAAGYTYLKLKTAGGDRWAAVSQTKVKKGENVTVNAQMTLDDFESKTLNRKFEKIIFGTVDTAAAPAAAPAELPAGHPSVKGGAMPANAMGTAAQHMAAPANVGDVRVAKAEGANAMTVAEIWSGKASLNDKPVIVRGKVVKFLGGIMGRNWLHLRDGSGSAEKGDHDVTVTTSDTATVGDVVVVSGVVHVDRDFGAGYRYPVIVENATVKK